MRCLKSGGDIGEVACHRMETNWERYEAIRYRFPRGQTISTNDDVLDLRVVHFGHVQWLVTARCFVEQRLDFVSADFVSKISDKREAIEDGAGHIGLLPELSRLFCIQ